MQQLDVPVAGGGAASIRVVHLKNADALKLAQVLRAAFAAQGSGNGNAAGSAGGSAGLVGGANNPALRTGALTNNPSSVGTSGSINSGAGGIGGNGSGTQSQAATAPIGQSAGPSPPAAMCRPTRAPIR